MIKRTGTPLRSLIKRRTTSKLGVNPVRIKPKKLKPSQLRSLKKKLEAAQKAVVIQTYGNDCFTCSQKNLTKSNCQLGHVPWPRSVLSPECIYDVRFTRIQCFRCNIHLGGMGAVALQRMRDEGIDVDAMRALNEATKGKPVAAAWFQAKLDDYTLILGLSTSTPNPS